MPTKTVSQLVVVRSLVVRTAGVSETACIVLQQQVSFLFEIFGSAPLHYQDKVTLIPFQYKNIRVLFRQASQDMLDLLVFIVIVLLGPIAKFNFQDYDQVMPGT